MNNEDSLNVVFKISNSIDYEVKDKIVTILEKQDHPIQNFFRKLKFRVCNPLTGSAEKVRGLSL